MYAITPISEPGKLVKPPVVNETYSPAGDTTTSWPGRSPARSITAPWPAKMPCVGKVTAVVKPALRAASMRLSERLSRSAARSQLVLEGRSSGPRATAAGGDAGVAGGPGAGGAPPRPCAPGVAGAASGMPQVLSASVKPG